MSAPRLHAPPDAPARGPDPAAAAAGRDLERLIDAEIDALPEPFREAFVLCEIEERTAAAAAAALGCPVGTIESRLTRARARLRERLAGRGVTAGALVGLGLGAAAAPAAAAAGAVATATGAARAPALWAVIADRAVGKGVAALGLGFVSGLAVVGLGGLVWAVAQSGGRPDPAGPVAAYRLAPTDAGIPEPEQFRRNRFNFPLPPEAIARVGDPWLRHGAVAQRLAFSRDGRFLATAGPGDRWLRVWDLTAGRPRMHLPLGAGEVPAAVALTADGATLRALVYAGDDRAAQLREYDTYRALEVRRRPLAGGPATTAVFDADAYNLLETSDGWVCLIQAATATELWRVPVAPGSRVDAALCAAAKRIVAIPAGADRARILDLATGRTEGELVDPGARLNLATLSADGRRLAAWCSERQKVRVWDLDGRNPVRTIDPGSSVAGLAFSPDGEDVLVFAGARCPTLWPVAAAAKPRGLDNAFGGVAGRFSPDGTTLAVANPYGVVQLFDARTGRLSRPAVVDSQAGPGELLPPVPTAFSPDGQRLLVRGFQSWQEYTLTGDVHPWVFVPGGRPREQSLKGMEFRTTVAPDRSLVARCTAERTDGRGEYGIDLLDATSGAVTRRIGVDSYAHHPAFSPDGRLLYAVAGKVVRGWDVRTGREVMRGKRNAGEVVYRVLVSADGRYVGTADNVLTDVQRENAIQVWDAATGDVVLSADGCQARPYIAFSPDGRRFAAVTPGGGPEGPATELRVWDLASRQSVVTIPGYDGQPAFSPDSRTLAVTCEDSVALVELATRQVRHVFRHHGPVEPAVVWRPDGRVLAAASSEAPIYLWDVVGDRTGEVAGWNPAADADRWAALMGDQAPAAFQALRQCWANPEKAVPFVRARVGAQADARLASRACEAMELIATADAKGVLAVWAQGPVASPLVREAKDSLRRLSAAAD
jgi:WD40 repeat protein